MGHHPHCWLQAVPQSAVDNVNNLLSEGWESSKFSCVQLCDYTKQLIKYSFCNPHAGLAKELDLALDEKLKSFLWNKQTGTCSRCIPYCCLNVIGGETLQRINTFQVLSKSVMEDVANSCTSIQLGSINLIRNTINCILEVVREVVQQMQQQPALGCLVRSHRTTICLKLFLFIFQLVSYLIFKRGKHFLNVVGEKFVALCGKKSRTCSICELPVHGMVFEEICFIFQHFLDTFSHLDVILTSIYNWNESKFQRNSLSGKNIHCVCSLVHDVQLC
mmetsp:Transcript_28196/g.39810  ORF Transcript_28196/g.39810 Transcript_28196/m.39810 type:complete len:275 (-) Transcript_28196:1124-1948(-)